MIVERIENYVRSQITCYPCHSNRASSIGDPCERKLVYHRVAWDQAKLPDVRLKMIFNEGNLHEQDAIDILRKSGFRVYEQQRPFVDRVSNLTGHVDAVLGAPAAWAVAQGLIADEAQCPAGEFLFPCDVKSMNEHVWNSVNCQADFNNPKKPWLMKYPAQIISYDYFKNMEWGCLICKDKSTGAYKEIWIKFDYAIMDGLLKKADRINAAVATYQSAVTNEAAENGLPARVDDLDLCKYCDFAHLCRPGINFGQPFKIEDDPAFVDKLDRRMDLADDAAEYSKLDKAIKESCKASANAAGNDRFCQISGDWQITGKRTSDGKWLFDFDWIGEPKPV